MGKSKNVKKHVISEKIVSNDIDKNWVYDVDTQKFSHPMYPNQFFKPLCRNKMIEHQTFIKDNFGRKREKIVKKMVTELFPYISPDEDNRNIGYTTTSSGNALNFDVVPNKMKSFWDTRRGKRYISYISYRKQRDSNKKLWLENNLEQKS